MGGRLKYESQTPALLKNCCGQENAYHSDVVGYISNCSLSVGGQEGHGLDHDSFPGLKKKWKKRATFWPGWLHCLILHSIHQLSAFPCPTLWSARRACHVGLQQPARLICACSQSSAAKAYEITSTSRFCLAIWLPLAKVKRELYLQYVCDCPKSHELELKISHTYQRQQKYKGLGSESHEPIVACSLRI